MIEDWYEHRDIMENYDWDFYGKRLLVIHAMAFLNEIVSQG